MAKKTKARNDFPFPYHAEIELDVSTLTNLGVGLGRIDGWVVMVPFALPGERIRARVFRNHKSYSEADLVEVITPSPHRIQPLCPLFGTCGGCQYQNLAHAEQLRWKRTHVSELLERLAGLPGIDVRPVIPSPLPFGYRSKITPHFQAPRRGETAVGPIGFLQAGHRFNLVDVAHCPIASASINERLTGVREEILSQAAGFKKGATLLLRDCAGGVVTNPQDICVQPVGELVFHFAAGDFFQNNPSILPAFVDHVRTEALRGGARFLVDAYCGSGLFALSCARSFDQVTGIEVSEGSIAWARENANLNRIGNARFHLGSAENIFVEIDHPPAQTAVVIDPPRKGCSPEFLDQLFAFGPASVVYVSCDPATQMRDLVRFRESGYRVELVQPFDLFPQTRHLECVVTLARTAVNWADSPEVCRDRSRETRLSAEQSDALIAEAGGAR